jgi:replication factor A1
VSDGVVRKLEDIIKLLEEKTGIGPERLMEMIKQKQEGVGGGYLSEVGAAYLVAADLGVHLAAEPVLTLRVSDLTPGLKGVTILGRILTVGELKESKSLQEGSKNSFYRKLVLYDQRTSALVLLWRDAAKKVEVMNLVRGDTIKIGKVNVGASRDYHVTIHAYEDANLEKMEDADIPNPRKLLTDIRNLSGEGRVLGLRGVVLGAARAGINSEGETEFATFKLRDLEDSTKIVRVIMRPAVIEPDRLNAQAGRVAHLYNVRVARTTYGELRIRFDDESDVEFEEVQACYDAYVVSARDDVKANISYIVGVDDKGNYIFIEAPLAMTRPLGCILDKAIRITVRRFTDRIKPQDIVELKVAPSIVTSAHQIFSKIAEIKPNSQLISLRAITISRPIIRKMKSREGRDIELCRLLLGDETGEIELVAWQAEVDQISKLAPGQRVVVRAARPKIFNDSLRLELTRFSLVHWSS